MSCFRIKFFLSFSELTQNVEFDIDYRIFSILSYWITQILENSMLVRNFSSGVPGSLTKVHKWAEGFFNLGESIGPVLS